MQINGAQESIVIQRGPPRLPEDDRLIGTHGVQVQDRWSAWERSGRAPGLRRCTVRGVMPVRSEASLSDADRANCRDG